MRGIDLASSVEQAPGQKDFDKLADLFDAVDALRAEQPQQDEPQDASS